MMGPRAMMMKAESTGRGVGARGRAAERSDAYSHDPDASAPRLCVLLELAGVHRLDLLSFPLPSDAPLLSSFLPPCALPLCLPLAMAPAPKKKAIKIGRALKRRDVINVARKDPHTVAI